MIATIASVALAATATMLTTPADPGGAVNPGEGSFDADLMAIEEGDPTPWLDEPAAASDVAAVGTDDTSTPAGPPSCLVDQVPSCLPDRVCEPLPGSESKHVWFVYTYHGGQTAGACEPGEAAAEPARITPGRVLQAFRRIPLPAATLDIQPPGGKTLVNLDTIFSTTTSDLDRTITLLGRRIQLRITPTSYTWHHGDGTTQTSDWPGRPWQEDLNMDTYLTHAYEDAHATVRPSVDVNYTADYRIGDGLWQPVNGTVTIQGPPSTLRILEARPVLTGAGR